MIRGLLKKVAGGPDERAINLLAFGKHPGWGDHMPDLGTVSDRLIAFKQALYTDGIGKNINSGRWQEAEGRSIIPFDHWGVVLDTQQSWILARLWASRDGTTSGRSHYPFVVSAEAQNVSFDVAGPVVMAEIESLGAQCMEETEAGAVATEISQGQSRIDQIAQAAQRHKPSKVTAGGLARAARAADAHDAHAGLVRLIYRLERDIPAYRLHSGKTGLGKVPKRPTGTLAYHIRVPRWADDATAALNLWRGFCQEMVVSSVPLSIIAPNSHDWVDLIFGMLTNEHLACLRLGLDALASTTDIPYEIDGGFDVAVDQLIIESKRLEGASAS